MATNGVKMGLWGKYSPLVIWTINCNFSQTRKSGLTNLAEMASMHIDLKLQEWLEAIIQAKGLLLICDRVPRAPINVHPHQNHVLTH